MADPVLDRLRAARPAPPAPVDTDRLWEVGRRRRQRSVISAVGGCVTVALLAVLALPWLPWTPDLLAPIADQPEDATGALRDNPGLVLGPEVLWVAPEGLDAAEAASAFLVEMESRWTEHLGGGVDVPEGGTETVVTVQQDGGTPIRLHLFREPADPDQWYVVAVDTEAAPLVQDGGRAVLPIEPVPDAAVTFTLDLAVTTGDAPDPVSGPVDEALLDHARDVLDAALTDGSLTAALLRYRDEQGRLVDARGVTFGGRWADIIAAETSNGSQADPVDQWTDPELAFEDDAVWTSPAVADIETAARTFGWHTFGWEDVEVTGEVADGPTWLEIVDAAGVDAPVQILLSPDPTYDDAWHVLQVGDGRLTFRTGPPAILEFGPISQGAVLAEVLAGSHRSRSELELTGAELAAGRAPLLDADRVASALIRFRDTDGRLIGAIGATFADEPGRGVNIPPEGPRPDLALP